MAVHVLRRGLREGPQPTPYAGRRTLLHENFPSVQEQQPGHFPARQCLARPRRRNLGSPSGFSRFAAFGAPGRHRSAERFSCRPWRRDPSAPACTSRRRFREAAPGPATIARSRPVYRPASRRCRHGAQGRASRFRPGSRRARRKQTRLSRPPSIVRRRAASRSRAEEDGKPRCRDEPWRRRAGCGPGRNSRGRSKGAAPRPPTPGQDPARSESGAGSARNRE